MLQPSWNYDLLHSLLIHMVIPLCVCRSADPAAVSVCELVAFEDTATVAATLFLPATTVQLLQGYLFWVAETFVAPQFASILGTPLGPNSGGMLVNRSIYQWLYGEMRITMHKCIMHRAAVSDAYLESLQLDRGALFLVLGAWCFYLMREPG